MILTPGGGPVGGPTSKDGAGFLVEHSVRFDAPTGERSEAPYPYEVLDEDPRLHVIEEGDLLHVHLYPELDPELGWGATWVAVDLEFDDGVRLSDLGALDQYGFGADAAEQGEERVLVADQWNDVQVDLSPALGHRIVGVHVVADPPAEGDHGRPAAERATGWIDPPRVVSAPTLPPEDDPVAWVDTRRGTNSSARYSRGNTLPITALPHGFARFTPVTDARTGRWPYRYQQDGDRRNRPLLQGIAVTHQPSPWMGDRNRFQLMPLTGGTPDATPAGRAVPFTHAAETARPDLYAVRLADGTRLRLSPPTTARSWRCPFRPGPGDAICCWRAWTSRPGSTWPAPSSTGTSRAGWTTAPSTRAAPRDARGCSWPARWTRSRTGWAGPAGTWTRPGA